jgi:hypothetical protein
VLCKARPEAVSQAKPGPNRPSQAGPYSRLHDGFGPACIFEKPKPSRQAAAFQWAWISLIFHIFTSFFIYCKKKINTIFSLTLSHHSLIHSDSLYRDITPSSFKASTPTVLTRPPTHATTCHHLDAFPLTTTKCQCRRRHTKIRFIRTGSEGKVNEEDDETKGQNTKMVSFFSTF